MIWRAVLVVAVLGYGCDGASGASGDDGDDWPLEPCEEVEGEPPCCDPPPYPTADMCDDPEEFYEIVSDGTHQAGCGDSMGPTGPFAGWAEDPDGGYTIAYGNGAPGGTSTVCDEKRVRFVAGFLPDRTYCCLEAHGDAICASRGPCPVD